jgi:hypothetical protein
VAFFVGCLLTAGGFAFCVRTQQAVLESIRQKIRDEKIAGKLAPELQDVDIETFIPGDDFGVELSKGMVRRLAFADFLQGLWFIWVPALFALCIGAGALCGRK